jgi:ABC-2 type transport system permease protein
MVIDYVLIAAAVIVFGIRVYTKRFKKSAKHVQANGPAQNKPPLTGWRGKLYTVGVFTKLSTKRFFRDHLALFFGILFPLIFLFVFGSLTVNNNKVSFSVAVIDQSKTKYATELVKSIDSNKIFKVNHTVSNISVAESTMDKNQLDGTIVIPSSFGETNKNGQPTGNLKVVYTENEQSSGQTLASLLQVYLKPFNAHFVPVVLPFNAVGEQLNQKSLTEFDYTFSGLLGFTIAGIGIFGPVNVFPELKKQGILRRLHTTPIRVWQYFMATMFSQAITGSVAVLVQFIVAVSVFGLTIDGNYFEMLIFIILSIFMILGIGLAIGGWAKNERQAAPLSNIIVFPMLFLSGTFFPRYLMPEWLQKITNYLPLTPVIDGLRMLTTEGKSLFQIGPQLGLIGLWLVVIYVIAFRVFRWE